MADIGVGGGKEGTVTVGVVWCRGRLSRRELALSLDDLNADPPSLPSLPFSLAKAEVTPRSRTTRLSRSVESRVLHLPPLLRSSTARENPVTFISLPPTPPSCRPCLEAATTTPGGRTTNNSSSNSSLSREVCLAEELLPQEDSALEEVRPTVRSPLWNHFVRADRSFR